MKRDSHVVALSDRALDWAYEKWLDGYTVEEIAKAIGISQSNLSDRFKKAGYTKIKPPLKPPKDLFD